MKFIRNFLFILFFLLNILFGNSLSSFKTEKIEYFFPSNDSLFIRSISLKIQSEIEKFEKIFNYQLKYKTKILFPDTDKDFKKLTGGRLPDWSGAVAISENRTIIIKPQQFVDNKKLLITLKHELIHIIVGNKYYGNKFPLWLNEGLATYLSNNYFEWDDGLIISNAIAANKILELSEINQLMLLNTASANLAYIETKIAVEFLINQIGISNLSDFLNDLNNSNEINIVFKKYLGYDLIDFEFYWYNYMKDKYQGIVALNFDNMIWYFLIIIVIIAFIVVKIRNYKKKKSWEKDDVFKNAED